ncbi:MAG: bifunctional (p)ppGpp synthetase/guanosine-3',5'-bis(diphosphate) 3'-pyrophosphohydrolase [Clostridiales bacterium]|nr:bifunctional (p)ppGpp synthetase/guanosine-3',5'-bis(diphosphate) 3'-pyrophosphohydrolase [Clostridiales bacterium]
MRDDPVGRRLAEALDQAEYAYDRELLERVFGLAQKAHKEQLRLNGDAYISHPVEVALILLELGMDNECIAAALLHDVVEDTPVTTKELRTAFGPDVATLVEGVTKLGKIPYTSKEEEQVENLRKMFMATAKDIRVLIIKLADRLHNMRTLEVMPDFKRREKSRETMEVYAPLAHRLGMQRMKVELEDLALRYLDPVGYGEIQHDFAENRSEHEQFLGDIMARIRARVEPEFPGSQVSGRIKHTYSVYQKMYKQNKTLREIYDLYAVRIIVDSMVDCYNVLGIVHDLFKPIPGKFKDYISTPKPNMYQSLHTTVMGTTGFPFEVQIRTWEMHRTAEFGIAAHWKYKRGLSKKDGLEGKLEWVRHMLEIQQTSSDPEEFMRTFKIDFFDDEVFVFTPRGDLINLPLGATAIDFAYAIHSEVGHNLIGAKANGKMVTLDYQVQNGDIIEVFTVKEGNKGPSRDWLGIVVTSGAKGKIRQWFKREKREENIQRGREEIRHGLRQNLINLLPAELDELLGTIAKRVGITGVEELYAAIGYGGISANRVMGKVKEGYAKLHKPSDQEVLESIAEQPKPRKRSDSGIIVEGIEGCLVKFARCCNPLPGDDVVGYVTKGYGVSVHRRDCKNFHSAIEREGEELGRWIAVRWDDAVRTGHTTDLDIYATNRGGLLVDLTQALSNLKVSIHGISAQNTARDAYGVIHLTVEVLDVEHLNNVMAKLQNIKGVSEVKRAR